MDCHLMLKGQCPYQGCVDQPMNDWIPLIVAHSEGLVRVCNSDIWFPVGQLWTSSTKMLSGRSDMSLSDLVSMLEALCTLTGSGVDLPVTFCCTAELMSDKSVVDQSTF